MNNKYTEEDFATIGRNVVEKLEKKRAYVKSMRQAWKDEGERLRKLREALNIPRSQIAKQLHMSVSTLYRLEAGDTVKRRQLIVAAYKTVVELVLSRRTIAWRTLK